MLTQDIVNTLPILTGDFILRSKLYKTFSFKNGQSIIEICNRIYKDLITQDLKENSNKRYNSVILYSPQYKLFEEDGEVSILIITPFSSCKAIDIIRNKNIEELFTSAVSLF